MPDKSFGTIALIDFPVGVTANWLKFYQLSCISSSNFIGIVQNFMEIEILDSVINVPNYGNRKTRRVHLSFGVKKYVEENPMSFRGNFFQIWYTADGNKIHNSGHKTLTD